MHADRTNRTALTVFAALVLLTGVATMVLSAGGFGDGRSHHNLFGNAFSRFVGRNGDWLWPTFAVLCVLIVAVMLRWILVLLTSTDRATDITVPGDRTLGRTTLEATALSKAVSTEISTYRGVATARARVIGEPGRPVLVVTVTTLRAADFAQLRHRVETEAFEHARAAVEMPELPITLDIGVGTRTQPRV